MRDLVATILRTGYFPHNQLTKFSAF